MYDLSNPNVSMTSVGPTQPAVALLLAQAAAQGFAAISPLVQLSPANTTHTHPAFLSMTASRSGGSIYQFAPGQSPQKLPTQDTYDHVWDISGVGSGVYTFVITAKKAGQSDIHASGKIGIVK